VDNVRFGKNVLTQEMDISVFLTARSIHIVRMTNIVINQMVVREIAIRDVETTQLVEKMLNLAGYV